MASQQQQATMDDLPGDVLSNIFIRLLAKQLAQMRCVSKSWNALLSHSSFIKSHLQHSVRNNNDDILLFFRYEFSFRGGRRTFTASPCRSPHLELTDFIKPPDNIPSRYTYGNVIGSVNGLICFAYGTVHNSTFYIWNPSLSVVLTLPPSLFHSHDYDVRAIPPRFGYDPKTDDYKVVKVTRDPHEELSSGYKTLDIDIDPKTGYEVEVFSMRKRFWKIIPQRFPYQIDTAMDMHGDEFCVNVHDGHVHWLPRDTRTDLKKMVAFDLGEETFGEIPLPDSVPGWSNYDVHDYNVLGVLGGKLCVMFSNVKGGGCEVWVMEEYGVAESWVKHCLYFPEFDGDIIPYGFTLRNELLFEGANCYDDDDDDDRAEYFGLYDPIAANTKGFEICPEKVVEYVDSLVWVAPVEREMNYCCSLARLKL